jgi:hypothetical protein
MGPSESNAKPEKHLFLFVTGNAADDSTNGADSRGEPNPLRLWRPALIFRSSLGMRGRS